MSRFLWRISVVSVLLLLSVRSQELVLSVPPLSEGQHARLVALLDQRWERFRDPSPKMGVRSLFSFALRSAEADHQLDRITGALALAEQMQDLDPESRTYGNFRWYWGAERPEDLNAVEFSMQDAALLWMRHRDRIPQDARERLERLMTMSIEGIRRHRVRTSYTNIFLMKTWNCIALGEQTGHPKLAREGYAMLDSWLFHTWENGISEYISPTYYGVDLDCLLLIAGFSRNHRARRQAEAAVQLFWTDIAANWFEPGGRLGGSHSRDYDYLTGHGYLDQHLRHAGWLETNDLWVPPRFAALTGRRPPTALRRLALETVPRMVRQRWGALPENRSAHYVGRSVSLGTAGSAYGMMDKVFTFQFAGGPGMPVANFMMDARNDPFGRKKNPTGGGHMKAFHLQPFVMSVQRDREALVLAAISPEDRGFQRPAPDPSCLLSHLVLPRGGVQVWIGDSPLDLGMAAGSTSLGKLSGVRDILMRDGAAELASPRFRWRSAPAAAVPDRTFEVEDAVALEAPFVRGRDPGASGGRFAWAPGAEGDVGPGGGRAVIPLSIPEAGSYYLLARVLTPTPSDDSFRIRIRNSTRELVPDTAWHTGARTRWTWLTVSFAPGEPAELELPKGLCVLEILCREDGARIDQILLTSQRTAAHPVPAGTPVFVRSGDAAAGIRVLHGSALAGGPAPVELRTDVAAPSAMTLTVVHAETKPDDGPAAVALWTRVAEGLDDAGFARFRATFSGAAARVQSAGPVLDVSARGLQGPLRLRADLATYERQVCEGEEPGAVDRFLSVNGRDYGREILGDLEPVATYRRMLAASDSPRVAVPGTPFEAEAASFLLPPFETGEDLDASGGRFVWQPGAPGEKGGGGGGRALVPVRLSEAGTYYIWGRVKAATPDDDSFHVRIRQGGREVLRRVDWHTGVHETWEWAALEFGPEGQRGIVLPEGVVLVEILCRENGTKLDRLLLTAHADYSP